MKRARAAIVLAVVLASASVATAHHSNPLYFDVNKAVTVEGEIVRVEWINPHVLLYLKSIDDKGQPETWVLHGASLNTALRTIGAMKDRLKPGETITARGWPARNDLLIDDTQTVLLSRPDDARRTPRIVGAGQIRFANGDVLAFGGGPKF